MRLEGSCHCGKVRFSLESHEPWPYQRCYCSICRKTGSGGFMINLGGDFRTMQVQGEEHLHFYRASEHHKRFFCRECGCHLWAHHDRWPDLVHPVASAIDTALPAAPAQVHMMVDSKASWVPVQSNAEDEVYPEYPRLSLSKWHEEKGYND